MIQGLGSVGARERLTTPTDLERGREHRRSREPGWGSICGEVGRG
jgi:hypothetical protein